ncbi:hypothetical protein ColTof4_05857 [Colletotrichum tofieldiae]|nr:hypothetical protein ColTof3_01027 [Colletotrichum tofieldiae]GKT73434.1 hypothetical protein ColTof4_05857 [Colletotrichum tofieldiae]
MSGNAGDTNMPDSDTAPEGNNSNGNGTDKTSQNAAVRRRGIEGSIFADRRSNNASTVLGSSAGPRDRARPGYNPLGAGISFGSPNQAPQRVTKTIFKDVAVSAKGRSILATVTKDMQHHAATSGEGVDFATTFPGNSNAVYGHER